MDALLATLWPILGVGLLVLTVPGTLALGALTLASWWYRERPGTEPDPVVDDSSAIAIVVPAHDEEPGIATTLESLRAAMGPRDVVVVVAHNCTDGTAARARAVGARVIEFHRPDRRGKSHALNHAFGVLLEESFSAFAVVDADTEVDPRLLHEMRAAFAAGADAVQVRYLPREDADSVRNRLRRVAFAAINIVRPRGRAVLGLSAGLVGNGFALHRRVLEALPYEAHSIAEDLAYHVMLVRAGFGVRYLDHVEVRGDMPAGDQASRVQRARWEGGRLGIACRRLPGLVADVARGRWRCLEPAADLALLPLGYHVPLLVAAVAVPWEPARWAGGAGLLVVATHVLTAVRVGGGGPAALRALGTAPLYVLWKLGLLRSVLRAARRDAEWVRTPRR